MHRQRKKKQVTWEEYRDSAKLVRGGVRKDKAQSEMDMARCAKNKKGLCKYTDHKKKIQDFILPVEKCRQASNNKQGEVFTAFYITLH